MSQSQKVLPSLRRHVRYNAQAFQRRINAIRNEYGCIIGPDDRPPVLETVTDTIREYQIVDRAFNSEWMMRQHDRANYNGTNMHMRYFTWRFMRALRRRGLPFYVHTAYRPLSEQVRLKSAGNSHLYSGPHQRGCAVDIVHCRQHWEIPIELWRYVGSLGEEIANSHTWGHTATGKPRKIEWGGHWKDPWDPAHWQLSDWSRHPKLREDIVLEQPLRLSPYSDRMRFG